MHKPTDSLDQCLGTKAETLKKIYGHMRTAKVLPQFTFTTGEWQSHSAGMISKFQDLPWSSRVIVRSSALNEDTQTQSQAGKYESIADVSGEKAFRAAVERVIASYEDSDPENQVLVQPMLEQVAACGVAFTLDPNTGGNYYVVNYDKTGSTSAVTSGNGKNDFLYYQFKKATAESGLENRKDGCCPKEMQMVTAALKELEDFFGQENLDVEFAITEGGELYILQVRALCLNVKTADREEQFQELQRIERKIRKDQTPKPFLCGKKAIYGVMTDWNPAEMIGIRPKPLAMSLYQEVITDSVWAYQRDNYGYRNLRSFPLMVDFGGLPYIDIRVSFNSFVPAGLDEEISEKLVDYYLERLAENPEKHDKAEFEIVFSCYSFDLPERIQVLKEYGFSEEEIEKIICALRDVTNHITDHKEGLWRKDYEKIKVLEKRYDEIMGSDMGDIEKVYWLLEDCKRYGTLPFAGLARAGFIAVQILQSMVGCGILMKEDYELFMGGVNTVSSGMSHDFKELSPKAFLDKYGHLRPGTYDITSFRYDEAPELYFDWEAKEEREEEKKPDKGIFRLSLEQLRRLKQAQEENGLTNDVLELMDFIKTAIEGREYGKFAFTRNLSKAIQMIGSIGEAAGIAKEDCAYMDIQAIRKLYASTQDIRSAMLHSIERGKSAYGITRTITLPPLMIEPEEVMQFYYPNSEPNFITSDKVEGEIYLLDGMAEAEEMEGKILLIPSADPGYDWIFSHGIKGFITMYGGANSHMAIRAGELGIPAAVGVGSKDFEEYKKAHVLELDPLAKWIRVLK